jgi:hypothetical protein
MKNKLYVIGGQSGAGKSTITGEILKQRNFILIQTDLIRWATRNAITGENPDKHIQRITFKGTATYQLANDPKIQSNIPIERNDMGEDDLAWLGVVGMINAYDNTPNISADILVEGVAAKPAEIDKLKSKLKNFEIKNPVFLGYSDGPDGLASSEALKKEVEKFGFKYFDRTTHPIHEHVQSVIDYVFGC